MRTIDETATENLRGEMRENRGEIELFTLGEIPEPIGVVAEWYRTKSNGNNINNEHLDVEVGETLATSEHLQTQQTGAGSTVLPV